VILFKADMAQAILEGRKTVTRRRWKRARVKVGSIHKCYTRPAFARPPGKPFARVRIVSIWREEYPGESPQSSQALDAGAEGFCSWGAFAMRYAEINGVNALDEPCYRVEFVLLAGEAEASKQMTWAELEAWAEGNGYEPPRAWIDPATGDWVAHMGHDGPPFDRWFDSGYGYRTRAAAKRALCRAVSKRREAM